MLLKGSSSTKRFVATTTDSGTKHAREQTQVTAPTKFTCELPETHKKFNRKLCSPEIKVLEAPNWQQLSDLFVFRIYIVCGFEEEDSLERLHILSCFV